MLHKNGFTMIEMLFCLSIMSMMILFCIPKKNIVLNEGQLLENLIERAQIYSMTHKEKVYLEFQDQCLRIYTLEKNMEVYHLESSYRILNPQTLYFNERGHINHGATIEVGSYDTCYKIIFNLGTGRYYVET